MRGAFLIYATVILTIYGCQKENYLLERNLSVSLNSAKNDGGSTINLTQGMVAYYPFNGNAYDESGYKNDGIVFGATLVNDRFNKKYSAFNFNGTDNYIYTTCNGVLGSNQRSLSFWARTGQTIATDGMSAVSWGLYTTGNRFDGFFNFNSIGATANIGGAAITYSTPSPVNDNRWHHYIFQIDTDNPTLANIKVYQDGSQLFFALNSYGLLTTPVNTLSGKPVQIGKSVYDGIPCYFNGQIDDVRIYNRALNQKEIAYLAKH